MTNNQPEKTEKRKYLAWSPEEINLFKQELHKQIGKSKINWAPIQVLFPQRRIQQLISYRNFNHEMLYSDVDVKKRPKEKNASIAAKQELIQEAQKQVSKLISSKKSKDKPSVLLSFQEANYQLLSELSQLQIQQNSPNQLAHQLAENFSASLCNNVSLVNNIKFVDSSSSPDPEKEYMFMQYKNLEPFGISQDIIFHTDEESIKKLLQATFFLCRIGGNLMLFGEAFDQIIANQFPDYEKSDIMTLKNQFIRNFHNIQKLITKQEGDFRKYYPTREAAFAGIRKYLMVYLLKQLVDEQPILPQNEFQRAVINGLQKFYFPSNRDAAAELFAQHGQIPEIAMEFVKQYRKLYGDDEYLRESVGDLF